MHNDIERGTTPALASGDRVTICNNYQCVTYTYQQNHTWDGGNLRTIDPPPSGGNGTERPTSPPPRESGIDRQWNHVCGTASGGTGSSITCIVTP
jgi:hypothetical protein